MRSNRIIAMVFYALTALNFFVCGLLGLLCLRGDERSIFLTVYIICLVTGTIMVILSRLALRNFREEREYHVWRLRRGKLVWETQRYKRDESGRQLLQMSLGVWLLSLMVPVTVVFLIWPNLIGKETGLLLIKILGYSSVAVEVALPAVSTWSQKRKGEML